MQDSDIDKIATLARLRLSGEERGKLLQDIQQIIEYIGNISSADTTGVAPMRHPPGQFTGLRQDLVTDPCETDLAQEGTARDGQGHYLVPRVVE